MKILEFKIIFENRLKDSSSINLNELKTFCRAKIKEFGGIKLTKKLLIKIEDNVVKIKTPNEISVKAEEEIEDRINACFLLIKSFKNSNCRFEIKK